MHYIDNNATTRTCDEAKREMTKWIQACSNPSSSSRLAERAATLLKTARAYVRRLLHAPDYDVIFTSGATESNCLIIRSVADAWLRRGQTPHIIASAVEHKSVLECLAQLVALRRATVSILRPGPDGVIRPDALDGVIRPATALVTVIAAGNETGAVNPIGELAGRCHAAGVPFHSDCVQLFGKTRINMTETGLDALSMSFHKIYGPMGVGMLVVRRRLVEGYRLESQLTGTQEGGLRGGTENVPGIAGGLAAMAHTFAQRAAKNRRLLALKRAFLAELGRHYQVIGQPDTKTADARVDAKAPYIYVMGPPPESAESLPNTVLLSVVDTNRTVCNGRMKAELERLKYIVSIGSACNTASTKASHVLGAIGASPTVKRGTLRFSFGDDNTPEEARGAAAALHRVISTRPIWL